MIDVIMMMRYYYLLIDLLTIVNVANRDRSLKKVIVGLLFDGWLCEGLLRLFVGLVWLGDVTVCNVLSVKNDIESDNERKQVVKMVRVRG